MGNAQTKLYLKLSAILPGQQCWECSSSPWCDAHTPGGKQKDRDQFVHSLITVLTKNGSLNLSDNQFHLYYSRRQDNDRVVARIVSQKNGVIKAKLDPLEDGQDHAEAFMAMRRYVELRLDEILREIPESAIANGGYYSDDAAAVAEIDEACRQGQPPAYGNGTEAENRTASDGNGAKNMITL